MDEYKKLELKSDEIISVGLLNTDTLDCIKGIVGRVYHVKDDKNYSGRKRIIIDIGFSYDGSLTFDRLTER